MEQNILLKIDVQGYEYEVLRGAEVTLANVDTIIVETSYRQLYLHQPLFDDIYLFLRERGFVFSGILEQILNPVNGEVLQSDSIFQRIVR